MTSACSALPRGSLVARRTGAGSMTKSLVTGVLVESALQRWDRSALITGRGEVVDDQTSGHTAKETAILEAVDRRLHSSSARYGSVSRLTKR